jgi:hypothetical protein
MYLLCHNLLRKSIYILHFNTHNLVDLLPYCRSCGTEHDDNAKFCSVCGASLTSEIATNKKNVTPVIQHTAHSVDLSTVMFVIVALLLVGCVVAAVTVESFDCPQCHNNPLVRWVCPYCGYDGKVTLFQLLFYIPPRNIILPLSFSGFQKFFY